ncbi:hypothetical protein [Enterococcus hermanniensis]|uniref:Uncharacterized protein n=1 Tax=Enterococcus hermanniensis TaxID=249189 RepID=A0A1L8TQF8_9ENTE|nr:hypothetical protein [Enterococcus hermanniensis]OJG46555.1 hypothetical protein RV04_GL000983 [Enterococcus hermanniensis]
MIIFILMVLMVVTLIAIRHKKLQEADLVYWERINEYEEQRKEEILRHAIEKERLLLAQH